MKASPDRGDESEGGEDQEKELTTNLKFFEDIDKIQKRDRAVDEKLH